MNSRNGFFQGRHNKCSKSSYSPLPALCVHLQICAKQILQVGLHSIPCSTSRRLYSFLTRHSSIIQSCSTLIEPIGLLLDQCPSIVIEKHCALSRVFPLVALSSLMGHLFHSFMLECVCVHTFPMFYCKTAQSLTIKVLSSSALGRRGRWRCCFWEQCFAL